MDKRKLWDRLLCLETACICFLWPSCMSESLLQHTHTPSSSFPLISSRLFLLCVHVCVCVKGQSSTCGFEALVSHDNTSLLQATGGEPKRVCVYMGKWGCVLYVVSSSASQWTQTTSHCRFWSLQNVVSSYRKSATHSISRLFSSFSGSQLVKTGVRLTSPCPWCVPCACFLFVCLLAVLHK